MRERDLQPGTIQQTFVQWSQPYGFDNGSLSSVGISDNGTVLEVHNGPGGDDGMFYRVGNYTTAPSPDLSTCISWQPVQPNGIGACNPISADINDQFAVQVFDSDKNLFFQWAPLPAGSQGQLNWSPGDNYTSGEQPAIAMNNRSQVVAVHQDSSIFLSTLWYATGAAGAGMGGASEIAQPDGSSITGDFMQVAVNDQGTVVVAYRGGFLPKSNLAQLSLIAGTLQPDGSIVWGFQFTSTVLVNGSFDIALDDQGNLLILCATTALGKDYLGWITGTVTGTTITLPPQLPWPLLFTTFIGDNVTMAMNQHGNLIAETAAVGGPPPPFQYFVGQAYFNMDYSHWMADNLTLIGDIPLSLVALPGSHDSGTFPITSSSDISPDNPSSVLSGIAPAVASGWAQAQSLDFLQQLNAGIRYFDLRVCYRSELNAYFLCHGFYGAALDELFSAILAFYQQGSAYASEIVLLDMNHIYTDSDGANWEGNFWMPGGPNGQFPALCQFINDNLGTLLLPPGLNGKSINEIAASPEYQSGGRVILFFDDTFSVVQNTNYWPNVDSSSPGYWQTVDGQTGNPPSGRSPTIASFWPNVPSLQALVSGAALPGILQQNVLPGWSAWLAEKTPPALFTVLQCIGTEDNAEVAAGLFSGPPDLQSWEAGICSPALFWLAAQPDAIAVNVVLVDWLQQTIVTPLCIQLNLLKSAQAAAAL